MSHSSFLWEFLKSPSTVGAVAPSSKALARMMLKGVDFNSANAIVEYGAGTGVFTGEIVSNLRDETKFVSFEINSKLCDGLKKSYPHAEIIQESVLDLEQVLAQRGIGELDSIVSGLPFAVFSEENQKEILRLSSKALKPGGTFRTFAYLQGLLTPAGNRFRKLLNQYFPTVRKTPVVWGNLPPAFVYVCEKADDDK